MNIPNRPLISVVMVGTLIVAILGSTLAVAASKKSQGELDDMYAKTLILLSIGEYDEAALACQALIRESGNQPRLIQLQRKIELEREASEQGKSQRNRENELKRLIIREVNFQRAAPASVIEWLRSESAKLTADKVPLNFVWMVPEDTKLKPVTLTLKQVPLLDVVRYATQAAGLKYRVEPHAIVIFKNEPATASSADVGSERAAEQ